MKINEYVMERKFHRETKAIVHYEMFSVGITDVTMPSTEKRFPDNESDLMRW